MSRGARRVIIRVVSERKDGASGDTLHKSISVRVYRFTALLAYKWSSVEATRAMSISNKNCDALDRTRADDCMRVERHHW